METFRLFLIVFSIAFIVIGIFNIINLGKVLKDDTTDALGLSRTTVQTLYWLNLALVCLCGVIFFYNIILFLSDNKEKIKSVIPKYFFERAEKTYYDAIKSGNNPIEATQIATVIATQQARKEGKNLAESIKIGTKAGTQLGESLGYPKGDSKVISKFAAENTIKNEVLKYVKF